VRGGLRIKCAEAAIAFSLAAIVPFGVAYAACNPMYPDPRNVPVAAKLGALIEKEDWLAVSTILDTHVQLVSTFEDNFEVAHGRKGAIRILKRIMAAGRKGGGRYSFGEFLNSQYWAVGRMTRQEADSATVPQDQTGHRWADLGYSIGIGGDCEGEIDYMVIVSRRQIYHG
jgi:hypothetical protein